MAAETLILFTRNGLGEGPPELRHKLAGLFANLLLQDSFPGALAFYGEGVKLACDGSPILEQLRALSAKGVPVILCKTCLDYFGLLESVRVGVVGGMPDILTAITQARKVVSV